MAVVGRPLASSVGPDAHIPGGHQSSVLFQYPFHDFTFIQIAENNPVGFLFHVRYRPVMARQNPAVRVPVLHITEGLHIAF